jgi:hypothetical protein
MSRENRGLSVAAALGLLLVTSLPCFAASRAVRNPEPKTPEYTVQQALLATLDEDEKRGFDTYLALVHPEAKATQIAIVQIRRHSWATFRGRAGDYILKGTRGGFQLERREPEVPSDEVKHTRLFLEPVNNKRRSYATPIRLSRHGDDWLIRSNTL